MPDIHGQTYVTGIALCALALAAGLVLHGIAFRLLSRLSLRSRLELDDLLINALRGPARVLLPLLLLTAVLPAIAQEGADQLVGFLRHGIAVVIIVTVTWLGIAFIDAAATLLTRRHDIGSADNLEARRVHTQVQVLKHTLIVITVVLGTSAVLMTFPRVREIGQSLLVSAGVAGLAIGLAARPVLENIIAGLQLAFTQPIRVDDVVVVEGEWGRIEEITATYVVVRIWDDRRLIVPFSHFISQPFQNWTRRTADILGTVFLHADYSIPVDAVRVELERLCRACDLWDGRVCVLQVTDADQHTLQLRALVSARDSARAWDLRVHVREQLIAFVQREYPECLPRERVVLATPSSKSS